MTLKDNKWLSHAQDLYNRSVKNGDQITDNAVKSVSIDDINTAGVYTNDQIDTNNHALYGPTNNANLAPLYYPNLIYNSTFSNNREGWILYNNLNGYSSQGYSLVKVTPGMSLEQDESSLPFYQGTYHACWYNYWFNHAYNSFSPNFAFRIGIKYTTDAPGFKVGNDWENYGLGEISYIFKDSLDGSITDYSIVDTGDLTKHTANAVDANPLYNDKPNTIQGKTFSDPKQKVPFDEFYTPWGIVQPTKAFSKFCLWSSNKTINSQTISGSLNLFDPQLILINSNMTSEQLNKLDIRVLPTYGNDSVGFDPKGYTFN